MGNETNIKDCGYTRTVLCDSDHFAGVSCYNHSKWHLNQLGSKKKSCQKLIYPKLCQS